MGRILIYITSICLIACSSSSSSLPGEIPEKPVIPLASIPTETEKKDSIAEIKEAGMTVSTLLPASPVSTAPKKISILNNRISVLLPAGLRPMTQKEYFVKYGIREMEKDMLVYTDNELEANFLIHLTGERIDSADLQMAQQTIQERLKTLSYYKYIRSATVQAGNKTLYTMEFEIETLDSRSVSIIYLTIADQILLQGNFNYPATQRNKWQERAMQTIQSICVNCEVN